MISIDTRTESGKPPSYHAHFIAKASDTMTRSVIVFFIIPSHHFWLVIASLSLYAFATQVIKSIAIRVVSMQSGSFGNQKYSKNATTEAVKLHFIMRMDDSVVML